MNINSILTGFRNGSVDLENFYNRLCSQIESSPNEIWITKFSKDEIFKMLENLKGKSLKDLPLYGVPFAIKDNIDLADVKTTAACPKYAYTPTKSSTVVDLLIKAGAIPVGKTNMDQFATGLVGVRSPYGVVENTYAKGYVSGGSSSGSAVAVARNLCAFSLGTDTAGSGRVPAGFNKLIGFKPSRGLLSTSGVVPACRSLDCVSIFANDANDAQLVFDVVAKFDKTDSYSAKLPEAQTILKNNFKFGIPRKEDLEFFGDIAYENAYYKAVENLEAMGGEKIEIDFSSFLKSAKLLYEGAWVYERYASVGDFIAENQDDVLDVIKQIVTPKKDMHPCEIFKNIYQLQEFKSVADKEFDKVDFIVTPTSGTCYKIEDVLNDPIKLNSNLGYYTNYMNLLDYCAVSVPSECENSFPFGFTIVGKKFSDLSILQLANRYENHTSKAKLAVCGAHLKGCSLHWQLEGLGARLVKSANTANSYKMYAIANGTKPAMIRSTEDTNSFYIEIYEMSKSSFADFVTAIPPPLGVGKIVLEDGSLVTGFLGEPIAIDENAKDITSLGDWRKFV